MATIARAVPPWLHRVCIRDHGPSADKIQMLLLYALNSFMDENGSCFPGQDKIARASGLGVSTVRRETGEACEAGWIARVPRGAHKGQDWKSYAYRCCVPGSIDLAAIKVRVKDGGTADKLVEQWEIVHGKIDPETLTKTWFPQPGKRRVPSGRGGQAPPACGGAFGGEAPPAHARSTARVEQKHRPPTLEAPPACALEGFLIKGLIKGTLSTSEKEPEPLSDINIVSLNEKPKAPEARTMMNVNSELNPKPPEGIQGKKLEPTAAEAREVRVERIRKAIKACPDFADRDIAKMVAGATIEEVQKLRCSKSNGAHAGAALAITGTCESGQGQIGSCIVTAAANEGRLIDMPLELIQAHTRQA